MTFVKKYIFERPTCLFAALVVLIVMSSATIIPAQAAEDQGKMAYGGLLYDKWYAINQGDIPRKTNKSYPKTAKKKGKNTWRCKECHGWDYQGVAGAYGNKKNSHYTGIKGISGAAGADMAKIVAVLKDDTHGYTDDMLSEEEFNNLALFVSKGQVDVPKYISLDKKVKGDVKKGKDYYGTICAGCHGLDGKKIDDMPAVGKVGKANPWETLHKILNGQPGEKMPALRALPLQVSVDIVAYTQTLPK